MFSSSSFWQVFLHWINGFLSRRNLSIRELTDLCDGVLLVQFLEELTDTQFKPKYDKKPTVWVQRLSNIRIILRHLEAFHDVRLVDVTPDNVVNKDQKVVLALLHVLYDKFSLAPLAGQGRRPDENLLAWAKSLTHGYFSGVNIVSYADSFKDGRAFLALVDSFVGNKAHFDFDAQVTDSGLATLQAAFQGAQKHMDIPLLVDPAVIASGKAEDRVIVLVVSIFYHTFQQAKNRRDKAVRLREIESDLLKKTVLVEKAQLELQLKAEEIEKATRRLEQMSKAVEAQKSSKLSPTDAWKDFINRPHEGLLPDITIPFSVEESEGSSKFTVYHIKVDFGTKAWVLKRRFSEFHKLHTELLKQFGKKGYWMKLPSRRPMGNLNPTFVYQRRTQLEAYLGEVIQLEEVLKTPLFADFVSNNSVTKLIDPEVFKQQQIDKYENDLESQLSDLDEGEDWVTEGFS